MKKSKFFSGGIVLLINILLSCYVYAASDTVKQKNKLFTLVTDKQTLICTMQENKIVVKCKINRVALENTIIMDKYICIISFAKNTKFNKFGWPVNPKYDLLIYNTKGQLLRTIVTKLKTISLNSKDWMLYVGSMSENETGALLYMIDMSEKVLNIQEIKFTLEDFNKIDYILINGDKMFLFQKGFCSYEYNIKNAKTPVLVKSRREPNSCPQYKFSKIAANEEYTVKIIFSATGLNIIEYISIVRGCEEYAISLTKKK